MTNTTLRYIRVSPIKARLFCKQIVGMSADKAIATLDFMPHKVANILSKVISVAVSNSGYDAEEVVVISCRADKASVLKRHRPRARGRASSIRKPTSHIFVEVDKRNKKNSSSNLPNDSKRSSNVKSSKKQIKDS